MEFAGSDGENIMRRWIREEYAHISHKRDLGISSVKEEQRIQRELQLPVFNHGNPVSWINQLEDFFHFFWLNEDEKFKAALLSMGGDALQWFEWEHQRRPFYEWHELREQVMLRFGSSLKPSWKTDVEEEIEVANFGLRHSTAKVGFYDAFDVGNYSGESKGVLDSGNFAAFEERRLGNELGQFGSGLLGGYFHWDGAGACGTDGGRRGFGHGTAAVNGLGSTLVATDESGASGSDYGRGPTAGRDEKVKESGGCKERGGFWGHKTAEVTAGGPTAFEGSLNREGKKAREQNRRSFERGGAGSGSGGGRSSSGQGCGGEANGGGGRDDKEKVESDGSGGGPDFVAGSCSADVEPDPVDGSNNSDGQKKILEGEWSKRGLTEVDSLHKKQISECATKGSMGNVASSWDQVKTSGHSNEKSVVGLTCFEPNNMGMHLFGLTEFRPSYSYQTLTSHYFVLQLPYAPNPSSIKPIHPLKHDPPDTYLEPIPLQPNSTSASLFTMSPTFNLTPTQFDSPHTYPSYTQSLTNFTHSTPIFQNQIHRITLPTYLMKVTTLLNHQSSLPSKHDNDHHPKDRKCRANYFPP